MLGAGSGWPGERGRDHRLMAEVEAQRADDRDAELDSWPGLKTTDVGARACLRSACRSKAAHGGTERATCTPGRKSGPAWVASPAAPGAGMPAAKNELAVEHARTISKRRVR